MKLYNKKGLIFGLFWSVLGVSALVLEFVRPSSSTAVVVRDILLFSLLILFGVRQVVRAFSKSAAREDALTMQEQGRGEIPSDVLGSYTGTPEAGEIPEQDADDL